MPMRRKNTWCLAVIIGIFCLMLNCAAAEVRINEVMPHTNNTLKNEWVEIYNPSNEQVNLTNWIIRDNSTTNRTINLTLAPLDYGLIADNNVNFNGSSGCAAVFLLLNNSNFSCFEVVEIGNGLHNDLDSVYLYNGTGSLISNFSWTANIQSTGKSWAYNGTSWQTFLPTPGSANLCASQNSSENQSPQGTSSQPAAVNLSVDYDDEVESEEFNVSVMLYNLKNIKYDIKVYITFEENDTIISQTFDGSWKSSTYYIADAVEGPGSETSEIKMKIKDDYSNFEGDAKINVRIRESETENSVASFEDSITIKKSEMSNRTSSNQGTISLNLVRDNSSDRGITSNVIKLNSETTNITKDTKSNIYKSKVEYFKQYGIYAFAIVCTAVIFVLLKKKKE